MAGSLQSPFDSLLPTLFHFWSIEMIELRSDAKVRPGHPHQHGHAINASGSPAIPLQRHLQDAGNECGIECRECLLFLGTSGQDSDGFCEGQPGRSIHQRQPRQSAHGLRRPGVRTRHSLGRSASNQHGGQRLGNARTSRVQNDRAGEVGQTIERQTL